LNESVRGSEIFLVIAYIVPGILIQLRQYLNVFNVPFSHDDQVINSVRVGFLGIDLKNVPDVMPASNK